MSKGYEFMFILIFSAIVGLYGDEKSPAHLPEISPSDKARALFSPRLEYNEWMPVGRGDPLKNDPTFDYSPPVLDQVRYWAENNSNKDKNDILLLGVPSKKTSTKNNKEAKYGPVRRNFYTQELPTRLMPPPVQAQHNGQYPSESHQYLWSQRKGTLGDSHSEANNAFVNIQRPNTLSQNSNHNQQGFMMQQGGSFVDSSMFNRHHFDHRPTMSTLAASSTVYHTTKTPRRPLLQQALQSEAAPFSIQPSTMIKEYSISYYNPQVINSMEFRPTPSSTSSFSTHSTTPPSKHQHTTAATYTPASTSKFLPTIVPKTVHDTVTLTTLNPSMTTDSLFAHYKQPNQPMRGPMYLIIQGHSKVKTYGLKNNSTDKHLPRIVPIKVNEDPVIKHVVSQDEQGTDTAIKHLHTKPEKPTGDQIVEDTQPSAMESLLSLLDTSFGNLLVDEEPELEDETNSLDTQETHFKARNLQTIPLPTTITTVIERSTQARMPRERRSTDDVQEMFLHSSFQVRDLQPYRKGYVVSEARPDRIKLKNNR